MIEWHRTKSLSKGKMLHNDGLKNKWSANSLHSSWEFGAVFNVNRAAEDTSWLTKLSQQAKMTSKKQKVLKCVASLTGRRGPVRCKSKCEKHAGSGKRFENTTLFLD